MFIRNGSCFCHFYSQRVNTFLQFCFDFLCDRIDFPQRELPWSEDKHRRKEKDKKHYTEFYEKRTENMIRDVYSEDIRTWGYEFGD